MTTFPPGSICVGADVGAFTLNGVDINFVPSWGALNLSPLTAQSPPLKGKNRNLPGTRGSRPLQHFAGEMAVVLPFAVSGVCDQSGTPNSDEEDGLDTNIAYLMANVFDPAIGVTIAAVFKGSLTADVQVTGFDPVYKNRGLLKATLSLLIPYGGFA